MGFMGIGFRRKRQETVLDVVYSTIISDVDTIQSMVTSFSINGAGTVTLTADTYDQCRSLYFPDLPSPIPNVSEYATIDVVLTYLTDPMAPITGTEDAYFRLQLLSQRCLHPHAQNLAGIFGFLPNLAWTNQGPVHPEDVAQLQCHAMLKGTPLQVTHVDKFPYMVNYHIPKGVRIADASRVRLGAYLGEGTTIMPAGFVNFNAGTLGNAMVEGRVSAGVVIGEDSDVGGGASIMGTLSGGNDRVISVGKNCLLGANSGIGISLGDGCTVGAGVYVTAGKKVKLLNEKNNPVNINGEPVEQGYNVVKAADLSGITDRLFIEDSQTGELICKPNAHVIQLNKALHVND